MVDVHYSVLDDIARPPSYAHPGDAGADLVSTRDVVLSPRGGRALVPTGLGVAIPEGYAGLVLARSGLAINHGIACLNAPGLIDSGYRGEIQAVLVNLDPDAAYEIHRGDRIGQLVIVQVEAARFLFSTKLPTSERGEGGFGHTGR